MTLRHDLALIQLSKSYLAAAQYFVGKLKERTDSKPYLLALGLASTSGDPRSAFPTAQLASPNFHIDLGYEEWIGGLSSYQTCHAVGTCPGNAFR